MPQVIHREAGTAGAPLVCCVHGFPESGRMWQHVLDACADLGLHALAPDLPGSGHSPPQPPTTWAAHVATLDAFLADRGPVALVVHDWGGLIGLRWAVEHPGRVSALVISSTGFFADGKWHGLAQALRGPEGEQVAASFTEEGMAATLRSLSAGMDDAAIAEYVAPFATEAGRRGAVDLYRSGEFAELAPHEGALARLGVPTLLLWGEDDPFAPIAGAHRLQREVPHAELTVLPGTGHFVVEDDPDGYARAAAGFLARALLPH